WDGALRKFAAFEGYEAPTLISRDGVHPSFPKQYQNDYSPEALRRCGYGLRSYLTLLKYAEVLKALREPGTGSKSRSDAAKSAYADRSRAGAPVQPAQAGFVASDGDFNPRLPSS